MFKFQNREISLFLNYFNTNKCEDDVEIVKKIKQEVGKCCYHQNTAEKILKLERVVKNIKVRFLLVIMILL